MKKVHYDHVKEYCKENNLETAVKDYALKKDEMLELDSAIQDREFLERYIQVINNHLSKIYRGWWSEILDLKTWRTYAN